MITAAIAGGITFLITTLLALVGEGSAFILIPIFLIVGIDIHVAMATALLLNSVAMIVACPRYIKKKMVMFKVALPILIVAAACSPLGAYVSHRTNREVLLWLFVFFLLFASAMMFFYRPKQKAKDAAEGSKTRQLVYGILLGIFAGFMAGLLGVGGGTFIVPTLVYLGFNPKKASATTSFIVIFSSFSGFLGHASIEHINTTLMSFCAIGSISGALLGSWLMVEKLKPIHVKRAIGAVLLVLAAKMLWTLLG